MKLLDSYVSLTGITHPTINNEVGDPMNASEYLSYMARVSNPSNERNSNSSARLIKYLIDNKHWSPFDMINVVMEIQTTRDIARQILRHKSFFFQEFSQRYADAGQLGMVTREARLQDVKNRQSSIETHDAGLVRSWELKQMQIGNEARIAYKWALENGIAKEQARSVLPEGMQMSRMHMNGTLRSWMHYVELRCGNGTQKEHQEIARKCKLILATKVPAIREWLDAIPG